MQTAESNPPHPKLKCNITVGLQPIITKESNFSGKIVWSWITLINNYKSDIIFYNNRVKDTLFYLFSWFNSSRKKPQINLNFKMHLLPIHSQNNNILSFNPEPHEHFRFESLKWWKGFKQGLIQIEVQKIERNRKSRKPYLYLEWWRRNWCNSLSSTTATLFNCNFQNPISTIQWT